MKGMRGTEQLAPEIKPSGLRRKRKMKGRMQPYRYAQRPLGPTLDAMLKGSPAYLPNPADFARMRQKRRGR